MQNSKLIGVYACLDDVRSEILDMIYAQFMNAVNVDIRSLSTGGIYQAAEYQFDPSKIDFETVHLIISDHQNDVYQLRELDKG